MIGILLSLKRQYQLEMMREPLHSVTRQIYKQLIADIDIKMTLTSANVKAG